MGCSFSGGEGRRLIQIIRKLLRQKTVTNREVSWEEAEVAHLVLDGSCPRGALGGVQTFPRSGSVAL